MQLSKSLLLKSLLLKICGGANGQDRASRGRKSPAQKYWEPRPECRRKRRVRVKREPLRTSIQGGKKGVQGLVIVFMEMQAVTGFSGEI